MNYFNKYQKLFALPQLRLLRVVIDVAMIVMNQQNASMTIMPNRHSKGLGLDGLDGQHRHELLLGIRELL